jgi:hypothetical protein
MKAAMAVLSCLLLSVQAHAAVLTYSAFLDGPNESPPNASPGTGEAVVIVNTTDNTMHVHVDFSGLLGTTTASHIHCCTAVPDAGTAGVATTTPTFAGFPLGVTSGTYDALLDMTMSSSYNPAFISAEGGTPASAEAALFAGMAAGETYLNIHSSVVPGGEIRGFLSLDAPEPGTFLWAGAALVALAVRRRRAA